LRNLCEQLAAWHGILDELPTLVDDLRTAYLMLVRLPPPEEKPLVLVLDGLDEAKGWAPGVHIFFSARVDNDDGRDQWLARLGLSRDRADSVPLGRLRPEAIASLLAKAGGKAAALAGHEAFVEATFDVSAGDPFYLRFLVEDINSGDLTPDTVSTQPRDL
jgi:hypothetical protein